MPYFLSPDLLKKVEETVESRKQEIITFLQEAVRIPSVSCSEGRVVDFLRERLVGLGFDESKVDEMGNVYGILRGKKGDQGKTLLYNGHVDHVPPGDMEEPYSAKIVDGRRFGVEGEVIYGRGTADMKAGIVSMIMGAVIAKEIVGDLSENVTITGVVMEDVTPGHPGPKFLMQNDKLHADAVIITESTNLNLNVGHRGSSLIVITFSGRSCHASQPSRGTNALYHAAKFVSKFESLSKSFPSHAVLGHPTAAITELKVYPGALNVIPDRCDVFIDYRYTPEYEPKNLVKEIENLIAHLKSEDKSVLAEVSVLKKHLKSHTGFEFDIDSINLPFYTNPDESIVKIGADALNAINRRSEIGTWIFGTDGAYFANLGIPTIGIGPGEERFAHTLKEHVKVTDLLQATKIYTTINLAFCGPNKIY
jgi:putative selenium metabolism hydrolase